MRIQTKIAVARAFLIGRVARTLGTVLFFATVLSMFRPSGILLQSLLAGAVYVCAFLVGSVSFWIAAVLAGARAAGRLRAVLQLYAANAEVSAGKHFFGRLYTWVRHYTRADRTWNITVLIACLHYSMTESLIWSLTIALLGINVELSQIRKVIRSIT